MKLIIESDVIPDNFTVIVEYSDGNKFWWKNSKLHREDGPARELYMEAGGQWKGNSRKLFHLSNEKRCPKKGEFYLSGAIPEVYQAPNDLSTVFHIMVPALNPPTTIERNGLTYRLQI